MTCMAHRARYAALRLAHRAARQAAVAVNARWYRTVLAAAVLAWLAVPALAQPRSATPPGATRSTTFYVAAHPDDWQLFETPNAIYDALSPKNKAVFIYLTAGAAGAGTGDPSSTKDIPYYLARENGAKRSIRFVMSLTGNTLEPAESVVTINGHVLHRYVVGRTASYFFRLPDGNPRDGTGYAATGRRSLLRLHQGAIDALPTIDGSTTYRSWMDLVSTLTALIRTEAAGSPTVWINVHDPDRRTNPRSHPDHYQTGMAMQAAVARMPCVNQALYVDYAKAALPPNLSPLDTNLQIATIATVVSGVIDDGFRSEYGYYRRWFGRAYYRVIKGIGPCRWP